MKLPRTRFTVRRLMIGVACLGLCSAGALQILPFEGRLGTIYSKDYDETKFRSLRAGMSASEIESIMGPPLKKAQFTRDVDEVWYYSDQINVVSSYWRRWVYLRQGQATQIINDYWID